MDINWQKQGVEALSYLKGIGNKVKQIALQLTEIEVKVEDATNNEPWGPHGKDMAEITKASYELENYKQIMGVIARRLQDQGEDWRHVYKSLLLLEYMSKHGPQKVVEEIVSNVGVIEKLTNFTHKDANGRDWGLNVRQRAKELVALVTDTDRIRGERQKAKSNASKYTGVSSEDVRSGGFGAKTSSYNSTSSSTFGMTRKYSGGLGGSSGLGSTGFGSGSRGSGYTDYDEPLDSDPKEATRERIERLKKEGAVELEEASGDKGAIPPAKVPVLKQGRAAALEAKAEELKGPKRLSEFKVNPNIAASLGQLPAAAAPQARPASNGTIPAVHAPAAASPAGLLLQLDAPAAAAPAAAAPAPSGGQDEWDAFAGGKSTKPAASDDWMSGFGTSSNGAGGATTHSSDPFGQLSGPPHAAPAASHAAAADPFAQLSAPGPSAPPPMQASADPFADAFSAPSAAAGGTAAASRAAPASAPLSDDIFSMPALHGASMGGMQGHFGSSGAGDFGMYGQQPQAASQPEAQHSFNSGGFGSFQQPFGASPAPGPNAGSPGNKQASQGLQSHAPLNPASTQALGGPSKSKDPFADLAFV